MTRRVLRTVQQGFTLIELVIVLVILGILAAVAVPKYVDLTKSASTASLQSLAGAVTSSAALNFAYCSTQAATGGTGCTNTLSASGLNGTSCVGNTTVATYVSALMNPAINVAGASPNGTGTAYTLGGASMTVSPTTGGPGASVSGCTITTASLTAQNIVLIATT